MIDELHVQNLALIADATLEPSSGLTVLTGETGAGKSALLSAIQLLIGDRASGDAVRDGAEGLLVEGRVVARDDPSDDGHVYVRAVTSQGRSKVSIDGSLATVAQLAQTVGATVDLCGQHEHQKLLSQASHLPLLDSWAGPEVAGARQAYAEEFDACNTAQAALDRLLAVRDEEASRVEDARFALARIDEVAPQEGELEELGASLPRLQHAEALAQAANAGYEAISGEGGALDALEGALSQLDGVADFDPALASIAESLRNATFPLEDASRDLRRYRDDVDFDPEALERAQARMSELKGIMRLFGPEMTDVLARREEARQLVSMVDDSERLEREARQRLAQAQDRLKRAADTLSALRQKAAPLFAQAVTRQMGRLHMSGASLHVDVDRLPRVQWTRSGADRVCFGYQPGEGMSVRPFAKIASGGEVSRVMLSVKVALGAGDDVETLIFDEIDAGVGGETARAVAEVLADLAQTHQVIVVTHLAQLAVRAQRHYVVDKRKGADGRLETHLELVEGEDRVHEVSRMLSGDEEEASLAHARRMLAEA